MLLKDTSTARNNQELVKASIDALVKALEAGHSEATLCLPYSDVSISQLQFSKHSLDCQSAPDGYQSCGYSLMERVRPKSETRGKGNHDLCPDDWL